MTPHHYADGSVQLTANIARPAGRPRAWIVVYPTIVNLTPGVERKALALVEAGFAVFIADFYGAPVPSFDEGRAMGAALRQDVGIYRARVRAAFAAARALAGDVPVAAIGYCMGGQAALELAREGAQIAAAVSYHGLLDTARPAEPGAVKARLLICHGDADPMALRSAVLAFWEEMDHAGAHWHFHSYSGVKHGFTDPASDGRGLAAIAYDAAADRASWSATLALFDELFPA